MKHTSSWKVSILSALIAATFSVQSATVPDGTTLAETQKIVRGNDAEVATLDPANAEGLPEMHVLRDLFEGLVIQDREGNVVPGVAESWETSDNKTFVFHLRKNAKWSNGDPVTAQDFVYSLKRAADPNFASANGWYLKLTKIKNIQAIINGEAPLDSLGIKALDDYTLQYELDSQVPYFVAMTAHSSMMPVHKSNLEQFGDKWTRPGNMVSNGAFVLEDWVINERIELVRNSQYYMQARPVRPTVGGFPMNNVEGRIYSKDLYVKAK